MSHMVYIMPFLEILDEWAEAIFWASSCNISFKSILIPVKLKLGPHTIETNNSPAMIIV